MPGGVNETNQRIAGTGHGGASGSWTEDSNTGCFCRGKWVSFSLFAKAVPVCAVEGIFLALGCANLP